MGGDGNYTIGPGFWGFVAFFVMAIALWLLVRNMSGRLRRMAYQERQREGAVSDREAPASGGPGDRPAPPVAPDVSSPGLDASYPADGDPHNRPEQHEQPKQHEQPEQPKQHDEAPESDPPTDENT